MDAVMAVKAVATLAMALVKALVIQAVFKVTALTLAHQHVAEHVAEDVE